MTQQLAPQVIPDAGTSLSHLFETVASDSGVDHGTQDTTAPQPLSGLSSVGGERALAEGAVRAPAQSGHVSNGPDLNRTSKDLQSDFAPSTPSPPVPAQEDSFNELDAVFAAAAHSVQSWIGGQDAYELSHARGDVLDEPILMAHAPASEADPRANVRVQHAAGAWYALAGVDRLRCDETRQQTESAPGAGGAERGADKPAHPATPAAEKKCESSLSETESSLLGNSTSLALMSTRISKGEPSAASVPVHGGDSELFSHSTQSRLGFGVAGLFGDVAQSAASRVVTGMGGLRGFFVGGTEETLEEAVEEQTQMQIWAAPCESTSAGAATQQQSVLREHIEQRTPPASKGEIEPTQMPPWGGIEEPATPLQHEQLSHADFLQSHSDGPASDRSRAPPVNEAKSSLRQEARDSIVEPLVTRSASDQAEATQQERAEVGMRCGAPPMGPSEILLTASPSSEDAMHGASAPDGHGLAWTQSSSTRVTGHAGESDQTRELRKALEVSERRVALLEQQKERLLFRLSKHTQQPATPGTAPQTPVSGLASSAEGSTAVVEAKPSARCNNGTVQTEELEARLVSVCEVIEAHALATEAWAAERAALRARCERADDQARRAIALLRATRAVASAIASEAVAQAKGQASSPGTLACKAFGGVAGVGTDRCAVCSDSSSRADATPLAMMPYGSTNSQPSPEMPSWLRGAESALWRRQGSGNQDDLASSAPRYRTPCATHTASDAAMSAAPVSIGIGSAGDSGHNRSDAERRRLIEMGRTRFTQLRSQKRGGSVTPTHTIDP